MFRKILVVLLVFAGLPSQAFFESKDALYKKLHSRGVSYVIEVKNKTLHVDHVRIREEVIDLATGEKKPYTFERLEAMDYKADVNALRRWMYGDIVAQAYSVSDVMVCYFYGDTVTYKDHETCLIFPHSVREVVKALTK